MTKLGPSLRTRAAVVTDTLREMIRSGELAAGTRLRQDHLAEQLGVSSTPVREALTTLTRERLVRYDPHRGAIVYPPTAADVRENFEMRLALEPLATRLAAERHDEPAIAHLRDLLAGVDTAVAAVLSGEDPSAYEQADWAFHRAIFATAERPLLLETITSLRDAAAAWAHLHTGEPIDPDLLARLHAHHVELVDVFADRDGDRARAIAVDHVWLTAEGSGAA